MIRLAQELGCFPPAVFADPAGHFLSEMQDVTEFPLGQTEIKKDILIDTRFRLENIRNNVALSMDYSSLLRDRPEDILSRNFPGKNGTNIPGTNDSEILAWAHFSAGLEYQKQARVSDSPENVHRATEEYAKAVAAKTDFTEALNNWGSALCELGTLTTDQNLFHLAIEKFANALDLKTNNYESLVGWGGALCELGRLESSEALYKEGIEMIRGALAIEPDYDEGLYNLGSALLSLATLTGDENYIYESEQILDRAEEISPNKCYNRACLAAVRGDEDGCRNRLERALASGTLPYTDHLVKDEDLKSVRDKAWFKLIVEKRRASS